MNNRDLTILQKILGYCEQIEGTHRHFREDQTLFFDMHEGYVYRNSVSMPILQIGELTKHLSEQFRASHSFIPWRAIMGMRDIFAHHYGSIDFAELWKTSHGDIATLKQYIVRLFSAENL